MKLEKEKLRLQELELKEKEQQLKSHLELTGTSKHLLDSDKSTSDSSQSPSKSGETVRKEDLNALIEKIYTEQQDEEENFLIEYTQPPTANPSKLNSDSSPPKSALKQTANNTNKIVMTKTSPIVAAALSCDEEIFTDLIDTNTKHQIIKQVHDSMDNLKNQLLYKGMTNYADDVDAINRNLEVTRKKQEELERIKREQEQIKVEKERIEQEKEKLRQEAELLRKEREIILMSATTKAAAIQSGSTPTSSSSSSSTTMNEQLESEYSHAIQPDLFDKPLYDMTSLNHPLTMSLSASSLSPARKFIDSSSSTSKLLNQPQTWLIEEVERKRLINQQQQQQAQLNHQQLFEQQQRLRRSFPNLLIDSSSTSLEPRFTTNSQINFVNTPLSSTSGITKIYTKKKSNTQQQSNQGRPIKLQSSSASRTNLNHFTNAKPPQPHQSSTRLVSNSANDLKNMVKHKSSSSTHLSMTPPAPPQVPVISLNQKCSNCMTALGQGSAMFIEKLGLAFHLKCFRCSVCNIPLGNGKEGTDVRVSITNRLHCNNCFSNDLGNCYLFDWNVLYNNEFLNMIVSPSSKRKNLLSIQKKFNSNLDDYLIIPNYLSTKSFK